MRVAVAEPMEEMAFVVQNGDVRFLSATAMSQSGGRALREGASAHG